MRRDPVGSVLETDRRIEFGVLRALEGSRVPCPRADWLDPDGRFMDRPSIVMQRFDGSNDHFVLEGGLSRLPLDARLSLARRYCETLAELHLFDWRAAGLGELLPDPGRDAARAAIDEWEAILWHQDRRPPPGAGRSAVLAARAGARVPGDGAGARRLQARQQPCSTARNCRSCSTGRRCTWATPSRTSAGSPTRCGAASTASPATGSPRT